MPSGLHWIDRQQSRWMRLGPVVVAVLGTLVMATNVGALPAAAAGIGHSPAVTGLADLPKIGPAGIAGFRAEGRAAAAGTSAPDWYQAPDGTLSPGLASTAMAYDPTLGLMVEFGGSDQNLEDSNITLLFNGVSWGQLQVSTSPPALWGVSLVYDPSSHEVVLFGGETAGGTLSNQTWLFNGTWAEQSIPADETPPGRSYGSMAYDAATGEVVLFGGEGPNEGALGDTWVYDGNGWTDQTFSTAAPSARDGAAMGYDPLIGDIVLFGGNQSGGYGIDTDTWTYDGSAWSEQSPANTPCCAANMDFDDALGEMLLVAAEFTGPDPTAGITSTWAFSGGNWVELSTADSPPWRAAFSVAYDPAVQRLVLFGGVQDDNAYTVLGDTWLFGTPTGLVQTSNTIYSVTQGQISYDLSLEGDNMEVSGAQAPVTYATTLSSSDVAVSSAGAISAPADTPPGEYLTWGTDSDGVGDTGPWSVEVQVAAAPVLILPGGSVLRGSTVGDSYSQQFTASLSAGPYSWSITAGSPPPGLSLSSSGLLSGTTTKEGNYSFTIQAWDTADDYGASVATSLAVAPASLTVSPSSLPGATSGDPYVTALSLRGGVGTRGGVGPATFELASGSTLPAGLQLSSTGILAGTPTSSGSSSFSVVATDGDGFSTTQTYAMIVEAPGASHVTLSPGTLPELDLGQHLDQTLSASGGTAPYSYAITDGVLPEGFTLASGAIYGQSNEPESGQFTVTATDAEGQSVAVTYLLAVISGGVTVSPTTLPSLVSSQNYQQAITASDGGGSGPYQFTITSGSLPQNMSLASDGSDGVYLEGGPDYFPFGENEQVGTFTFTISAYDESSGNTGAQTYTLTVGPAPDIVVNHTVAWSCTVGVLCATQLKASGGTAPYSFALQPGQPGLPAGFTLSTKGLVKGTATPAEVSDSVYDVNLLVTDADGFTGYLQDNFYVVVPHHLKLSPSTLPDPVVGQAYDQLLSATGGGIPYTYSVTAGALPAGLRLHKSNGDISGTPTTPGPVPKFTVTATDANGYTTTATYKLAVLGAPTFTSPATAIAQKNLAKTKITIATAGSYPTPLMLISGALPAGLAFTDNGNGTATISGKTTAAPGSYPVTVTADNRATGEVTQTLTIWVYSGHLLPASKVFYDGEHAKYTITTQIPADLITITGQPSWVTIAAGTQPDRIIVSGTPPDGTSAGTYPTTVAVTGLAPPAKPPTFNIIVGA